MTSYKLSDDKKLKPVGVMVVHGIGRQSLPPTSQPDKLMYSQSLYRKLERILTGRNVDLKDDVAWREANYAHIFNGVQDEYYRQLGNSIKRSRIRQLVVENLGDAAAYRPRNAEGAGQKSAFTKVQMAIQSTFEKVESECVPNAPIFVIAHSLGGQVTLDYFKSCFSQNGKLDIPTKLENVQRFITFGCNIPLFMIGQPEDETIAFEPPVRFVEDKAQPWWINFYDRDDVLGYPLAPTGGHFAIMANQGHLKDIQVDAGNLLTKWNTLSHMGYWTNKTIIAQIALDIQNALEQAGE